MSLKNSFKKEDLFWYITVWNMFIISLPNAIQDKRIGYWITLGNLLLIIGLCVYVFIYNKRKNINPRKVPFRFLFIVFGFLIFVLWASGVLGRLVASHQFNTLVTIFLVMVALLCAALYFIVKRKPPNS